MFSAMSLNCYGNFHEEARNFEVYEELIQHLLDEGVLIELDELYTSDDDDYWHVIVYEHDEVDEELTDDMEYEIFYPMSEDEYLDL